MDGVVVGVRMGRMVGWFVMCNRSMVNPFDRVDNPCNPTNPKVKDDRAVWLPSR
jgi:hypothetical protein